MSLADFTRILYRINGPIAHITINRPERMNAIDNKTSREIYEAFYDFRWNNDLRVAIITGAGERSFSAGADLIARAKGEKRPSFGPISFGGITKDQPIYKPIIAAINGHCLAGGLELALACDIRISVPHARFGLPEVKWGIMPGGGGTQRLPRAIPNALANEMILTAEPIDADRALQAGLISQIYPSNQLREAANSLALVIARRGPLAVRAAKEAILRGQDMPLSDGLAFEEHLCQRIFGTQDAAEGPQAFAEKREPTFKGK